MTAFSLPTSLEQTLQKLVSRATYPTFIFCFQLRSYLSVINGNWRQLFVCLFLSLAVTLLHSVRALCGWLVPGGQESWRIPTRWAGLAHPTSPTRERGSWGGSWGVAGDSSSSRHWAHPWRMGQAKRGPGCQPVGQSSSVGPMAGQGRTVVEQETNIVWHRWR